MIEWAGWVGTLFAMVGIWLTGHRCRFGFLVGVLGGIFWGLKAYYTSQLDLITVEVLIIVTQLYAYFKWRN
jgi:hypothetical protein